MALLVAFGIGAAWITGFSLWQLWGVDVRADWIGITLTVKGASSASRL
ncbi:MAG TPA: hypothetical protein VII16_03135 [Actinomycetes bacterium]|jgi:hypothetical protein